MRKYIPADKLIAEIERLRNECAKSIGEGFVDGDLPKTMTSGGGAWVCEQLLSFIESMEKEYLPSNLDEAAENRVTENGRFKITPFEKMRIEDIMFGAEWMAGQGVRASASVGYYNQCGLSILTEPSIKKLGFKEGDDLEITIRKK